MDFTNAGKAWNKSEENILIQEYTKDKLSLLDICKIHKRKPGGIVSRLKMLKLIEEEELARGFEEYKQSNLYKQFRFPIKAEDKPINKKKGEPLFIDTEENAHLSERKTLREARKKIPSDLIEIKQDIEKLNKKMDKILDLIHSIYEFETQEN